MISSDKFVFELPFTDDGSSTEDLAKTKKKKIIFVTAQSLPYIKNRVLVQDKREPIILSPIENAIEIIKGQVAKLRGELNSFPTRLKSLQQVIQGTVVPSAYYRFHLVVRVILINPKL